MNSISLTIKRARALLVILRLPEDDWQPHDHDSFESARSTLEPLREPIERLIAAADARRRKDPVPPTSTKTAPKASKSKADPPELRKSKQAVRARSGGYCEARLPGCTGRAEHAHHRKMRSQGGSHRTVNLLDVCLSCHDHIHLVDVAGAYERGHLLHSWDNEGPLP